MASKSSPALGCSDSCNALDSFAFNSDGMMELKFRAWDRLTSKMSPSFSLFGEFTLIGGVHAWQHECAVKLSLDLLSEKFDSLGRLNDLEIMQSTGLKDGAGKEIYEGDLLRWAGDDDKNFTAFEVFFHDGNSNAAYDIGYSISRTHHQGNIAGGHIPPFKPKTTRKMIVIGNIYEHKHLLK